MRKTFREIYHPTIKDGLWIYQDKNIPYKKVKYKFMLVHILSVLSCTLAFVITSFLDKVINFEIIQYIALAVFLVILFQLVFWWSMKLLIEKIK